MYCRERQERFSEDSSNSAKEGSDEREIICCRRQQNELRHERECAEETGLKGYCVRELRHGGKGFRY